MGRHLSSAVQRELENLEKDAESRKMAMKALKSYVKDLDKKAIPQFLAQVSETKAPTSTSVEHTISLYEVLARTHGPNIVPQINNIMTTIIKTLTSSAGSFPLQQACSKVVPAIARYGIDTPTPLEKKRSIIHSLCKPLSDCLLGSQESLAFGAALCLKALVDSDNWRFASDELVNEVCVRVTGALEEKLTQTNSHMGLAMALAKHNNFTVEAYARSLIRSGLKILDAGAVGGNSQKRLSAIQMVNFLMKSLDRRSIYSELDHVIEELEKCHSDQMAFVRGAAFEALQTAKTLAAERKDTSSVTGSNFSRSNRRKNLLSPRDRSPVPASPESQTVNSFMEDVSISESPFSMGQISRNYNYDRRSVTRKLWSDENGRVDVSLKDGLYSGSCLGSNGTNTNLQQFNDGGEFSDTGDDCSSEFSGFAHTSPSNEVDRNATPPSPQRQSQINMDNVRIFTTPRRLIRTLQDLDDENSDYSETQGRGPRTIRSNKSKWSPTSPLDANHQSRISQGYENGSSSEHGDQAQYSTESVSSTVGHTVVTQSECSHDTDSHHKTETQSLCVVQKRISRTSVVIWGFGLLSLLVAIVAASFVLMDDAEEGYILCPT